MQYYTFILIGEDDTAIGRLLIPGTSAMDAYEKMKFNYPEEFEKAKYIDFILPEKSEDA